MDNTEVRNIISDHLSRLSLRWKNAVDIPNAQQIKTRIAREYRKKLAKMNLVPDSLINARGVLPFNFMTAEDKMKSKINKD